MERHGFFIVFEGIDGSGKTFHLNSIHKRFREHGLFLVKTKEPTQGKIGVFLNHYIHSQNFKLSSGSEALLFAADRYDHVERTIKPALNRGQIILSDRYYFSSIAYQGALGTSLDWIREMNRFAPRPDLAILLDIRPELSLQRVKNRKKTLFEDSDYLRKVRDIYLGMVERGELVRVDADRPRDEVRADIQGLIDGLLESREAP